MRHVLAGEDPDDPKIFARDIGESLEKCLDVLRTVAASEGFEPLSEKEGAQRDKPEDTENYKLGMAYFEAVRAVAGRLPLDEADEDPDVSEAYGGALLVSMKMAFLAFTPGPPDESASDPRVEACVPTLLLAETGDAEVVAALGRLLKRLGPGPGEREFEQARAAVRGRLDPLLRAVPEEARFELQRLKAAGLAPSPFATRVPGTPPTEFLIQ
jgi:hypothetical protein